MSTQAEKLALQLTTAGLLKLANTASPDGTLFYRDPRLEAILSDATRRSAVGIGVGGLAGSVLGGGIGAMLGEGVVGLMSDKDLEEKELRRRKSLAALIVGAPSALLGGSLGAGIGGVVGAATKIVPEKNYISGALDRLKAS